MLLPRLSIRWILGLMTVMAVLFVAVRQAAGGAEWAIAFVAFVVLTLAVFILYGLSFLVAYGSNTILKAVSPKQQSQNPFVVEGQYPPQVVPKNPVQDQV